MMLDIVMNLIECLNEINENNQTFTFKHFGSVILSNILFSIP